VGFALIVVYIALTIISPEQFGPEWANYHILLYLALFILMLILPNLLFGTHLRSSIQTFLLLGFLVAIALSEVTNGWLGGVIDSWKTFLPRAAVFFFIVATVTTIRRLKILTLAAVASCLVVVVEALCGYYGGFHGETFVLRQNLYLNDAVVGQLTRLRGSGFLTDPNDLAQMLLIALPLIFVAWRRRRVVANLLFVLVPAALLLWAVYLTHSRGALITLTVLVLLVARKRMGSTASAVLTTVFVLGMLALDFTGGRGISATEGAGRLEAWANGLEMFKSAPLFGIGFDGFADLHDITAHNSFVLCLAELGFIGSTIWVALLVTTMVGLSRISRLGEKGQMEPPSTGKLGWEEQATIFDAAPYCHESPITTASAIATETEAEGRIEPAHQPIVPKHWVVAMRLALVSLVTTGWFLSRSYSTTMYLILGLATATIALQEHATESRIGGRWLFLTLATEILAIVLIYGTVRLRS
jgi:putative inorganic carbon (HCO3(-)) transporter